MLRAWPPTRGSRSTGQARIRLDAGQVLRERADVRGDRHAVVVQDDEQAASGMPGIVERLVGEPAGHRPVPHDRDDAPTDAVKVARRREAERRGDRGRGMARPEGVERALVALEEAGDASMLPDPPEGLLPPGEDLVHVGLVTGVPDHLVVRQVERPVERHGQLHHAEARAEMPTLLGNDVDDVLADLVAQAREILRSQSLQVGRGAQAREERRIGLDGLGGPSGHLLHLTGNAAESLPDHVVHSRSSAAATLPGRRLARGAPRGPHRSR